MPLFSLSTSDGFSRKATKLRVLLATGLATALVVSVATALPAEAASKSKTSVTLDAIVDASPTATDRILSGDKVKLTGRASANLVGKTLRVQIKKGTKWVPYTGSGKVAKTKKFSIISRATGVGAQTYRVQFAGTGSLKPSSGSRSATVWQWFPLVDQTRVSIVDPFGGNAPRVTNQVYVAGRSYTHLLAGSIYGQRTASADFNLGYHCSEFTTTVGLGDSSPAGATGVFRVYFDGNDAGEQTVALGQAASFDLDASGFFRVRIEHSDTVAKSGGPSVVLAWPNARVLCSSKLG